MKIQKQCGRDIMQLNKAEKELSCSVISGDPLTIVNEIKNLEEGGIDSFHFDVMDGIFVPRLGLYPEYLVMLRTLTSLPIDVHMMIENPELFIGEFAKVQGVRLIPHLEAMRHPSRTLMRIRELGVSAGVAINPGTYIPSIKPLVEYVDSVMLMAINPGIVGHRMLKNTFERITELKELLGDKTEIKVIIDGGVTFENASELISAGADSIVCGAGTVFKEVNQVLENTQKIRRIVDNCH
jgi:ribulose-phosphate 3-epimerase